MLFIYVSIVYSCFTYSYFSHSRLKLDCLSCVAILRQIDIIAATLLRFRS